MPWWRGKIVQTAGIVALMYSRTAASANGSSYLPGPSSLVWHSLSAHLDDFQVWLLTRRAGGQGLVFALFDGFSTSIDHFVEWFDRFLLWMTWIGTTVAGVLVVARGSAACAPR